MKEHDFSGRCSGKLPGATESLKRQSSFPDGRNGKHDSGTKT